MQLHATMSCLNCVRQFQFGRSGEIEDVFGKDLPHHCDRVVDIGLGHTHRRFEHENLQ